MSTYMDQESLERQIAVLQRKLEIRSDEDATKQQLVDKLQDTVAALQFDKARLSNAVAPKDVNREKALMAEVAELRRKVAELDVDIAGLREENQVLQARQDRTTLNRERIHHYLNQSIALIEDETGVDTPTAAALRDQFSIDEDFPDPFAPEFPGRSHLRRYEQSDDATPFGFRIRGREPSAVPEEQYQEGLRGIKEEHPSDFPFPRTSSQFRQVPVVEEDRLSRTDADGLSRKPLELSLWKVPAARTSSGTLKLKVETSSSSKPADTARGGVVNATVGGQATVPQTRSQAIFGTPKPSQRYITIENPPSFNFPAEIVEMAQRAREASHNRLLRQNQETARASVEHASGSSEEQVKVGERKEPTPTRSTVPIDSKATSDPSMGESSSQPQPTYASVGARVPPTMRQERGNQPRNQQGSQPVDQQGNKPGNQPGSQPGNQQGDQPGGQQGKKPGNQPGNRPEKGSRRGGRN